MQRYKPPMIFSTQKPAHMHPELDGDYVLHSEAQAEIERLRAEVENLRKRISDMAIRNVQSRIKSMRERSIERDREHADFMNLVEQWETSHNDAIESAKSVVLHSPELDDVDNVTWVDGRPYICEETVWRKIDALKK